MQLRELIMTVGRKRFIALTVLIVICGVLGAAWQQWFIPQFESLTHEKNSVESDRSRLQRDIHDLPDKYKLLQANEVRYDELAAMGFTKQQDRIQARLNMDKLRMLTGVRGVAYDISSQQTIKHDQSYALNMNLVSSDTKVRLKGLSDVEIRDFIERIQEVYGGLLIADKVVLERKEELNEANLTRLTTKIPVDFVEGEAVFHWYNLVPKEEIAPASPEAQAFGVGAPPPVAIGAQPK